MNMTTLTWLLIELQGIFCFFLLFASSSESQNAVLFGASISRLLIAGVMLILLTLCGWVVYLSAKRPEFLQEKFALVSNCLGPYSVFMFLALFGCVFIFTLMSFFIFYTPAIAQKLEMIPIIFRHIQSLVAWLGLSSIEIACLIFFKDRTGIGQKWQVGKWFYLGVSSILIGLMVSGFYVLCLYFQVGHNRAEVRYNYLIFVLFTLLVLLWSWLGVKSLRTSTWTKAQKYLLPLLVFVGFFLFYRTTALAVGHVNTPGKSYFDQLAYAFLDGRMYLENPSSTMDLTLFKDNWYLAFPPLAAILMIPLAMIYGSAGFSTVTFTIFFAAINVALVFEMLQLLSERGWTKLRTIDNFWLVILFALGSIHWYMSLVGKVWYISRLLALTFMLLAAVLALKRRSPWLIGLAVGLAMGARPNPILIWPFLLGIYWQDLHDAKIFHIKKVITWTLANAVPILGAIAGLLWYNWLRFGNWLDFGYATMNVGVNSETLRVYGQFNPAFIPLNLYYMWVSLPHIGNDCYNRLVPNPQGISILLTTPPILYLLKSYRRSIWVAGAWFALLLQVVLLSMHTGYAWEFGYRYLMDFIIPVLALIALAAGNRVSWFLRVLILLGVLVNLWGVLWYFDIWCPVWF
jgi:hypothetical protein